MDWMTRFGDIAIRNFLMIGRWVAVAGRSPIYLHATLIYIRKVAREE